ncbi:MAG: hypothetical protein GF364_20215 [Candidatus Lokiarchaeota archaeon]|nr:hypothetical protein [Candidatus Lokiarchaeota archaeon]
MIVFDIEDLENFMLFLPKRVGDEIFFHVDQEKKNSVEIREEVRVVLHFLGNLDESKIALYQTRLTFKKGASKETIYTEMKKVFEEQGKMKLINGRISEMFISIS